MKYIDNKTFWLTEQYQFNPNKIFIIDENNSYSFKVIHSLSLKAVSFLLGLGIKKLDHISILTKNNIEFIILVNALWFIGAVPIPINTKLTNNEIEKLAEYSDSQFVFSLNDKIFTLNFNKLKIINFTLDKIFYHNTNFIINKFSLKNTALLMYSSGSTGYPKCVQITFNNLYSSFISSNSLINHTPKDIWFASLPFFHIGGFSIFTRSLLSGCSLHLAKDLSLKSLVKNIKIINPSLISLVPTMLDKLINKNISKFKNLRMIFIGGGHSTELLFMKALKKKYPIVIVYGATETSSMVTSILSYDLIDNFNSVGKPLPGVKITLMNSYGKECKIGEVGEIVIKSKSVAKGYFRPKENMGSAIRRAKFYTNDLGKYDDNGNLILIGRKDDIVISGGENFNLSEIESFISTSLEIRDCCCVKINDYKWGQSYILFISKKVNKHYTENNIKTLLNNKFSKFKLPKKILFIDNIPRNEMGKVNKETLINLT